MFWILLKIKFIIKELYQINIHLHLVNISSDSTTTMQTNI